LSDDANYDRVRLRSGWLDLDCDDAGVWRIRWTPDPGHRLAELLELWRLLQG
jgi:hypothetical protein